jgi:tetratricopeptide (TPR) repeat protein
MIATAFISGRRGKAIYRKADQFYSLTYDGVSFPIGPGELSEVLDSNGDFEALQNVTLEALQQHLARSAHKQNGLFLTLSMLDSAIPLSTRVVVAQAMTALFEEEYISEFVRNRFFSRPLPVEYRSSRHEVLLPFSTFSEVHTFLHEVFECQPIIDEVRFAWDQAVEGSDIDPGGMRDIEGELVNSGLFYDVVQALIKKDIQQVNALIVQRATLSSQNQANVRTLLLSFRSRLQSKFFAAKDLGKQRKLKLLSPRQKPARAPLAGTDFITFLIENAETIPSSERQLSALESKNRVDKQISAIRDMLLAGKNFLAERYVEELLQFQLGAGDREHAAMSLCSLIAISLDANQLGMAERLSQDAMKLTAADPVVYTIRAEVLKHRGHFQAALNAYQEAKDRFSTELYAFDGYADVLSEMGRYPEALKQYKEIQLRFPDDPVAYNGEVSVLKAQGDIRKAVRVAVENTKQFPENAVTRGILAGCLSMIGKFDEAIRHYRHALSLDPNNFRLLSGCCFSLKSAGKIEMALNLAESYAAKKPSVNFLYLKAKLLEASGRVSDAVKIYENILQQRPTYTPARYAAASARVFLGQVDEAIATLPDTGMESEVDWVGYRSLALAFVRIGDDEEADRRIRFGIQNCPWIKERARFETALGLVELRRNRALQATLVLQRNLQRLENRYQQTRLLLLGHAQAERGEKDVSRLLITKIFSSKDSELIGLREDIIKKYGLGDITEPTSGHHLDDRIFVAELKLAMAA